MLTRPSGRNQRYPILAELTSSETDMLKTELEYSITHVILKNTKNQGL